MRNENKIRVGDRVRAQAVVVQHKKRAELRTGVVGTVIKIEDALLEVPGFDQIYTVEFWPGKIHTYRIGSLTKLTVLEKLAEL